MGGLSIWHLLILALFILRRYDEQRRGETRQLPRDQARPQEPIDVTPRPAEPAAPPPPPRDDEAR
jgi:sec-independent protein translocase protein TatA